MVILSWRGWAVTHAMIRLPRKNWTTVLGRGPEPRDQAKDHAAKHYAERVVLEMDSEDWEERLNGSDLYGGANLAAGER